METSKAEQTSNNVYTTQAESYLAKHNITENGYGYISIPVSGKIRAVLDVKYLTLFAVKGEVHSSGRDTAFLVSKEFKGENINVEKQHMKFAIGPKGSNISRLVKRLNRRITFVEV